MVRQMIYRLICTTFSIAIALTSQVVASKPSIELSIDNGEIYIGDAVVLEIESTGLLDPINIAPILKHATLVRETVGTQIAVIGGKVVEINIRRMDIIPNKTGSVVFGPLVAGETSSNSVFINVLGDKRPDWHPLQDDLQIKTSLSPEILMVNQQALFTIELLHRYPVSNESIELPNLKNFATRELLSERRTFKGDNREWFKTEWQLLLFPKSSGSLELGDIQWSGTASKSRIERATFSRSFVIPALSVSAAPDESNQWWLPSQGLQLTEEWSEPPTSLRAGDEIERTIKVQAIAVLAGQIPSPEVPESRAIQQTLINTTRLETLTDVGVVSTAEFKYRVKAQSPVPVFLDTVRMPWWNTLLDENKQAIIPARRINVALPDRADVLSQIALQETGVSRFKHWLESTPQLFVISYIAAVLAAAILIWLCTPLLLRKFRYRADNQRHLKPLRAAAQSGDLGTLYALLMHGKAKEYFLGAEADLVKALAKQLFSEQQTLKKLDLVRMLQLAEKQANILRKQKAVETRQVLAEL